MFCFAGHGFGQGRRNYLVLIDAPLTASEDTIDRTFIEFEDLAGSLLSEGTTIFMLDACRTDGRVEVGRAEEGRPGAAAGANGEREAHLADLRDGGCGPQRRRRAIVLDLRARASFCRSRAASRSVDKGGLSRWLCA